MRASPEVLEAMQDRTSSPFPLIATPSINQRVNSVYVEAQNASYGWIYRYSPPVRRVVDYIARNVAQLGLKVYERVSDDEREHRGDHPAAMAMRNPNPHTPGEQFIFDIVADFLVYNNAYALKFRGDNDRLLLVRIVPHMIGLVGRSHFTVEAYRIYRADGSSFDVSPQDVIHWRGYNPDDPRKGESYLETLREELASDSAARQATTELHRSGLALPGWIERPLDAPEWSDEARKRFEEDWANRAKQGKRRSPVLEEGMVFKQGGVSPEDAQILDGRRFTVEQVAGLYGMKHVPPENEDERRQFYADVLPPLTDLLAAHLGLQILNQEYDSTEHYFEFNMDEKLMGDDRLKALTSAAGAPPLTRNEARARLNLPAKEGGDELITPGNVIVGGKPSPMVMPIQDPNKPPQDGSHRTDDAPQTASLNGTGNGNGKVDVKALLIARREAQRRRINAYVVDFADVLQSFLDRQQQTLKSRKYAAKAVADERWERELSDDLLQIAQRVVAKEGSMTAARLGMDDFDLARTEAYLRTVSRGKAREITAALRDRLNAGEPSEVFEEARTADAPRAAQTLATTFAAFAVTEAGQQSPDAERRMKTWVVTSGNSAHPELDGETVPLGASFSNGADGPPADHPGCQCELEIT